MKRFTCMIFAFLFLLVSVSAYNGDVIVYVTNSGSKYHQSGCSYLKSSNAINLEAAIAQGYSPCSRCNPPYLELSASTHRGSFVPVSPSSSPVSPNSDSRTDQLRRELEEQKQNAAAREIELERKLQNQQSQLEAARARLKDANTQLHNTRETLKQAQEDAKKAQDELNSLKSKLQIWGFCGVIIGGPVMVLFIWQICWKRARADFERRVESEVLKRLARQSADMPSFQLETPASPPCTEPDSEEDQPLFREEENPYMKDIYRLRYEGKSMSKLAGVPDGFWFDDDYPRTKPSPDGDWTTVFIAKGGIAYHRGSCVRAKWASPVNICFARSVGRRPCRMCRPVDTLPPWVEEYQKINRIRKRFHIDMMP